MDESRRIRTASTATQHEMLLEFAETNRDFALGLLRTKQARLTHNRLWNDCAASLNCEGPVRTPKEWSKIWNDMKCRCRAKIASAIELQNNCGEDNSMDVTLTPLEQRIANLLGYENTIIKDLSGPRIPQQPKTDQVPSHPASQGSTHQQRFQPGRSQAQASRTALEESRAMVLRIEEKQAHTESLLAEAALRNAEAAKLHAEAAVTTADAYKLSTQTMATFTDNLSLIMPAILHYIQTQMKLSTENTNKNMHDK